MLKILVTGFTALGLAAALFCATPAQARVMMACTAEAKICPDGSAVSRTGPNCEFAPCPNEGTDDDQGTIGSGEAVAPDAQTIYPDQVEKPLYPDLPLDYIPAGTVSVDFLFEHRSALQGQDIAVQGVIDTTLLGDKACPPNMGMCAQPRITLRSRKPGSPYTVVVLLSESNHTPYRIGQTITINGIVAPGPDMVMMHQQR